MGTFWLVLCRAISPLRTPPAELQNCKAPLRTRSRLSFRLPGDSDLIQHIISFISVKKLVWTIVSFERQFLEGLLRLRGHDRNLHWTRNLAEKKQRVNGYLMFGEEHVLEGFSITFFAIETGHLPLKKKRRRNRSPSVVGGFPRRSGMHRLPASLPR